MTIAILTPAYGRDYKSKKALPDDFNSGKDFLCLNYNGVPMSTYISIRDFEGKGICEINFRYGQLRKVCVHKVIL